MSTEPTLQIRYGTFAKGVSDHPWRDCVAADVEGEVLAIKWDADNLEWIPLHVIRGSIQVRTKPDTTTPSTPEER